MSRGFKVSLVLIFAVFLMFYDVSWFEWVQWFVENARIVGLTQNGLIVGFKIVF